MSKEGLIQKYSENEEQIQNLKKENLIVLKELAELYEHKVGEIIKYKKHSRRNLGTIWEPKYEDVLGEESMAVLVAIKPSIWSYPPEKPELHYNLEFKAIKKDGTISRNSAGVNVNHDVVEWTGEIYKDFQNKEI